MNDRITQLQDNLRRVRDRIVAAAQRAGRDPSEITLVGVTKYVDAETTRELALAGCHELGESRPQTLWKKAETLHDLPIHWHQVGHVQRNKLRHLLPIRPLIHSVDSLRLLEAIETHASELSREQAAFEVEILVQVNVSEEEAKHGFSPAACLDAVEKTRHMPHVQVRGFMCMAGLGTGPAGARRDFARLLSLRDESQQAFPEVQLTQLSMGMSGDFEVAIAEGATIVRVGSALFEGIPT